MSKGKRLIQRVFALCFVLVLTACGASKLEKQLDLGAKYLEELDYDNAIAAYTAAIDVDPASIDAYVGLAKAYVGKGTEIDDIDESLDTILLAYKTLDDLMNDKETEYTGVEETMDSVGEYKADVEAAFVDAYYDAFHALSIKNDVEGINDLNTSYFSYVESFIDVSSPKSIEEVSIDEKSRKLFDDFLESKEKIYIKEPIEIVYSVNLEGNYTLDELESFITGSLDADSTYEGYNVSYLDCGKDGKIEMLLTISYEEYRRDHYTLNFIIANVDGKIQCVYDEITWSRSMSQILYNGLIYNYGSNGSPHTTADFYYLDGDYNLEYYYGVGTDNFVLSSYEGASTFSYFLTNNENLHDNEQFIPWISEDHSSGGIDFYSLDETYLLYGIDTKLIYDDNPQYQDEFNSAYEFLLSEGVQYCSISDIHDSLKNQREKIGLTNSVLYK